jgi:hypothetical protein
MLASSMLRDEDGDEAHEFFEENDQGKVVPVTRNLNPQVRCSLSHQPPCNQVSDIAHK